MGNKEKKKHKHRSRSRSPKYHKHKDRHKESKRSPSSDSSSDDSRSRSRSPLHDKKKHKKRSRSHSEERSKSKLPQRKIDMDRKQMETHDQQKMRKEVIKSLETAEEKRARRLAKKEAKEKHRKQKLGWDNDYISYTNADNPFGDEHLLENFVWKKKVKDGNEETQTKAQVRHRLEIEESRRELEKVKKRRQEREKEMASREDERELMQRDKEAEYFRVWEKQEDTFHLQQAKLRSKIRIEDGRAKPIDLLANYIGAEDDELSVEMHEPYKYLYGLTIPDLEDLLEDIKVYLEMEEGKNVDYWKDIIIVSEDELNKLRKIDPNNRVYIGDRREGINEAVGNEVSSIFKEKSTNQLMLLEKQIKEKLKGGEGIDVGYWESLLQQLKAHLAQTRLKERHQEVLRKKLFTLKREQGIESGPLFPVVSEDSLAASSGKEDTEQLESAQPSTSEMPGTSEQTETSERQKGDEQLEEHNTETSEEESDLVDEEDIIDQTVVDYESGKYSPKIMSNRDLEIDTVIYEVEDDMKKLELARVQVRNTGKVKADTETEFEKKAREGMNDEEAQFSVQFLLDQQTFIWSDKYRPRKPRFFNRVHTGFEWNKYNQTHYDIDNPPPKIVQGYKFNIFFPDLINKAETPEYTVTPIENDKQFGILRFLAGAPYEDIAFKVVNREWEYSYKRGFRCQFQNGIFQLWFHFKRYRYRR